MNHGERLRLWWSTAQGHRHTTETNCAYGDIGVTELFRFHILFDLAFVFFPLITESERGILYLLANQFILISLPGIVTNII
jgi:hypothetical protein